MRGEVLHYDEDHGFGFITGADGNRYTFARENLHREASLAKGMLVEFQASDGRARDIFSVDAQMVDLTAGAAAAPAQSGNAPFGRLAGDVPAEATGLWGYFRRGLIENYFNFAGRAHRKEFWGYCLFWTISLLVIAGIGLFVDDAMGNFDSELSAGVTVGLSGLFVLATFLPGLGMTVRRIHDIGLSGWFYLVVFIPTIGALIILVFALIPTQTRENQWGPVPAGVGI